MKKWMKNIGIVSAIAAVSVMSFAAVSFAQAETQTPSAVPGIVERLQNGVRGEIGGPGGERGNRGGEVDGTKDASLAERTDLAAERLAAMQEDVAARVASGEITQAQADEILARSEDGSGRGGERGSHASFADASPEAQAALADLLNLSVADIQTAVDAGQTIDQIAEAQGVDMADVKAVMDEFRLAELESNLAEKVAAGDITQEQADAILAQAQSGDLPGHGGQDGPRGHRGGPQGDAPTGTPNAAPNLAPDGTNFQAPAVDGSNL